MWECPYLCITFPILPLMVQSGCQSGSVTSVLTRSEHCTNLNRWHSSESESSAHVAGEALEKACKYSRNLPRKFTGLLAVDCKGTHRYMWHFRMKVILR